MSADPLPSGERTHQVLAMRSRTAPVSAPSAVVTLAWRALLKIKHVPFQLFDVTVTPIMFTLLFTFIFGGALAGTPREYIQYLLPGIMVQTVLFITVYTGVGLNTDIRKGLYDRFRSLPIWQPAPLFGALAGDLFRYTVAAVLIVVVGLILGFRPQGGVAGMLLALSLLLVFSFALSWLWIIVGMLVRSPESVMTTSFVFLFPLTFASASRKLMHGEDASADIAAVLAVAALIVAVAAPVAMRLYRKER
jgi:ABC-2 type transport system permease protein